MAVVVEAWMSVALVLWAGPCRINFECREKSPFARGFGVITLPILAADRLADWESADLPMP
jgi:hypothetical protein